MPSSGQSSHAAAVLLSCVQAHELDTNQHTKNMSAASDLRYFSDASSFQRQYLCASLVRPPPVADARSYLEQLWDNKDNADSPETLAALNKVA